MQGDLNEKSFQLYLLAFFQKCKQGYFPWYNIGVNSDGAKALDKVSRQGSKASDKIKQFSMTRESVYLPCVCEGVGNI